MGTPPTHRPRLCRFATYVVVPAAAAVFAAILATLTYGVTQQPAPLVGDGYVIDHYLHDSQQPVTWDPCVPIRFVIDAATMPPEAAGAVEDVLEEVSTITGLGLVVDRYSSAADYWADTYDPTNSRVLLTWSDPSTHPGLEGPVLDHTAIFTETTNNTWTRRGTLRHTAGVIAIDGPQIGSHTDPGMYARAVVRHELGHLLGLGHTDDPDQLMYSLAGGRYDFGPGDITGLTALGRRCGEHVEP